MTTIKEKDFVELEYTGRVTDEDAVFDTTDQAVAKKEGLDDGKREFKPLIICVGLHQVLPGLDKSLIGKEGGANYSVELQPEDAFGAKSAKMIQMIPMKKFKEQNIQPMPGMQINIDNHVGVVKTASGGRCMVDFNHPLAGKILSYDVKINKVLDDDAEKVQAFMRTSFGLPTITATGKDGNVTVNLPDNVPEGLFDPLKENLFETIPTLKDITFQKEQKPTKKE